MAKYAVTIALDHIEGKEAPPKYKLHPDSAYLGNSYYPTDTRLLPNSASSHGSVKSRASAALPAVGASPPDPDKGAYPVTKKPHVHIGRKPVRTPLSLPKGKYTVLRHGDLLDDDKIERTVGRNRDLYWVIKGAVVLMVKERSESAAIPPSKTKNEPNKATDDATQAAGGASTPPSQTHKSSKESMEGAGSTGAIRGTKTINPLRSPSVEGKCLPPF